MKLLPKVGVRLCHHFGILDGDARVTSGSEGEGEDHTVVTMGIECHIASRGAVVAVVAHSALVTLHFITQF